MKTILLTFLAIMMPFMAIGQSRIQAGDSLQISITGVAKDEMASISSTYMVTNAGYVKLPFIKGLIKASGYSPGAVARKIEAAYRSGKIFTNPAISIVSSRAQDAERHAIQKFVTVSGQVRSPGPKPHRPGMTLMEVVSMSAPNEFGATNRVVLLRNGRRHVYNIKKISAHQLLKVFPNDQITVPQVNMWGK